MDVNGREHIVMGIHYDEDGYMFALVKSQVWSNDYSPFRHYPRRDGVPPIVNRYYTDDYDPDGSDDCQWLEGLPCYVIELGVIHEK